MSLLGLWFGCVEWPNTRGVEDLLPWKQDRQFVYSCADLAAHIPHSRRICYFERFCQQESCSFKLPKAFLTALATVGVIVSSPKNKPMSHLNHTLWLFGIDSWNCTVRAGCLSHPITSCLISALVGFLLGFTSCPGRAWCTGHHGLQMAIPAWTELGPGKTWAWISPWKYIIPAFPHLPWSSRL